MAIEIGYRAAPSPDFSYDLTLFRHEYDHLFAPRLSWPRLYLGPPVPYVFVPFRPRNLGTGSAWGLEAAAKWAPREWLRLEASYSYLELEYEGTSAPLFPDPGEGSSPEHQFAVRSLMDLPHGFEFDTAVRYADDLPSAGVGAYWDLDLRLGWRIRENLEAEVVGQNLLRPSRLELESSYVNTLPSEVPRGVYAKVTWQF